ncbi:excisionase family DNA-binding protein [Terrabacter sp. C0L_2]|uniref:excisionase family DNA-binding protein n=1 Tax=Terrabacter sp. C0L_2 TaxID=3108389 RepID=UPI002ED2B616|nr:excisionase family DNA-binding protein [Terrabacter sp. C0L_2]
MGEHTTPQRRRYETLQSAAERLAVDTRTVRRWIAAGRLNAYRTGPRLIRVDIDEVDALLTPVADFVSRGAPSIAPESWRFPV